jgi:Protein of unknown function (DUF3631)
MTAPSFSSFTSPEYVAHIRPLDENAQVEDRLVRGLDKLVVLDEVFLFLGRFVAYPSEHAQRTHTLWIAHTHLMDVWESTPRLAFLSPEPASGKTRALELTETLVPRPVEAINVTAAYLFRRISDPGGLPTVLYDEIDAIFGPRAKEHEEIRAIINAGHRRSGKAGRCVVRGKLIETEELPAYCPMAVAGLGNLPDTILSRSVIIKMRPRSSTESISEYRLRVHRPEGNKLRDRLDEWAKSVRRSMKNTYPIMPDGIADRNADIWEPLLAVADAAGGGWSQWARVAAVSLVADARGDTPSLGVRLLADLRVVFGEQDALATVDLLTRLNNLEESPWGDLKGKPMDARKLANFLKPYGIKSKTVRIGAATPRGYDRSDLWDAWSRYLPQEKADLCVPPNVSATCETSTTVVELNDES